MNVWNNTVELAVRVAEDTTFDPNKVTPGVEGFLMTGLLAVAVIGLGFVLVRRMRANNYRHEVRDQIEAELAEQAAAESGDAPDRGDADEIGAEGAVGAAGVDSADSSDSSAQK